MKQLVTPKLANKALEFVSAGSNLKGTVNEVKANRMLRDAKFPIDKDTFAGRVASLKASKATIVNREATPAQAMAKAAIQKIIPENSINYIC